jgi:hypothetical protein
MMAASTARSLCITAMPPNLVWQVASYELQVMTLRWQLCCRLGSSCGLLFRFCCWLARFLVFVAMLLCDVACWFLRLVRSVFLCLLRYYNASPRFAVGFCCWLAVSTVRGLWLPAITPTLVWQVATYNYDVTLAQTAQLCCCVPRFAIDFATG